MNSNYIKDYIITGGIVLDNISKECTKPFIPNNNIKKMYNLDIYKTDLLKPKPLMEILSPIKEIKLNKPINTYMIEQLKRPENKKK